jgi:hypothetical protein
MGFRFQKRITLFKGLTLNLSKTGTSFTIGRRGASINVKGNKVTANVGLTGTGLSYRQRLDNLDEQQTQQTQQQVIPEFTSDISGVETRELKWKFLALIFFIALVAVSYLYIIK